MFQGVLATGKAGTFAGNNVMRFEAGSIRELWGQLDAVGLLAQLGVIQASPPEESQSWPAMTGERGAAEVVRRFAEKFNAGHLEVIADEFADEYRLDFPGGPTGRGKAGIRQATSEFRSAFPDLHFATEDLFEEGGRVAWRWTMTGTHQGALGPFPASGRPVVLSGISLFHVARGRIVRDCVRADMAGLLRQIGAV